jgi:hypothetical protein
MTKKELHKGNGLITQFMGWELIQTKDELKAWVFRNKKTKQVVLLNDSDQYDKKFFNKDSVLEFHNSWDDLIPVLNKGYAILDEETIGISRMTNTTGFNVLNSYLFTQYKGYNEKRKKTEHYNLKRAWKSVVEFIEWYNQQKIYDERRNKRGK